MGISLKIAVAVVLTAAAGAAKILIELKDNKKLARFRQFFLMVKIS